MLRFLLIPSSDDLQIGNWGSLRKEDHTFDIFNVIWVLLYQISYDGEMQ